MHQTLIRRTRLLTLAVAGVIVTSSTGCRTDRPQAKTTAGLFASTTADRPANLAPRPPVEDQPEPKYTSDLPPQQPPGSERVTTPLVAQPATAAPTSADGGLVAQPASAALTPAEPPKPAPSPVAGSGYMAVGGVVARVNGSPIYAESVFAHLDRELTAQARQMDADAFARHAYRAIGRELEELVHDEVLYTEADRAMTDDERKIVDSVVIQERDRRVKESGGSAEQAKRRAVDEDGADLDEVVRDYKRRFTVQLYMIRHVWPLVSVSASDLREFYKANADKLYTRKAAARYRVIVIDPGQLAVADPRATAKAKADLIRAKAVRGDDFAALASSPDNDDRYLRTHAGDPFSSSDPAKPGEAVGPNTYRVAAVDTALWALPAPGGVTAVVEADGVFYVAKLVDRTAAQTKPMDDVDVQSDMYKRLEQAQRQMYQERFEQASQAFVVSALPADALQIMMEMAMQKYAKWSKH